nr:MAG TPA: minor tail protein [Caudoviricetes sp.]
MVIKLGLDDADFGKGVANSKKQVQYLAKEMQANMKIADMAGNKLGKLGTRYDGLTQIIKAQENQVTALKKAYDGSFVDGKATDSTKRLANQLQDANGKLANYKLQLQNTAGQMARLQVETQGVTGWLKQHGDAYIKQGEKIQKFGGMVSKAGTALTVGVTAPIVAGATAVTKAAIDWESAFAGVKKTSDEVIDSNGNVVYSYADLETSLRGLAKELPSTHSEIAAVAEAAGQLGIQTQDITAFTKTMIDMGESTNLSAEEAATAIAKIANITGMTSSEYQRFGSSVVALGNNFATTEADIVQMSNRLASAGTLAGLSNQEILGLATAMSSVGIEAEAGGTAMTQTLTAIEKAAVEGGDSLDQFAKVAGMSSSEFAKQWNEKPIEAIQSFIKGLGELDGKGESATLMLDEMGLSGVRQSNMLKSLALASDTLSGAVDMSTQAWEENTALTNEAGTRYETTESKLKMLRNEAVDAAIEFGGPLVDALRDGLEASKPLIKSFGDMAKAFSSLDKEQQQNIIKWGLMAAAAGPALKLLGGGISVIGKTRKAVGLLSNGIVELAAASAEKKALPFLAKNILGIGTAATTASGVGAAGASGAGVVGLGTAIAGLAGPIAIGVVALGAIAGAVYLGKKAYDEHQLAGAKWGTAVTEEQDKVISKSYELRDKAVSYVNEYADGVRGSADKAITANQEIVDSIQAAMDKEIERKKAAAENLEDPETKAKAEKAIAYEEQVNEALIQQAQKRVDRINEILTSASKNNRDLSDQERQYIEANYKQLSDKQLEQAGFSKDQRLAIETAYQDDLSKLSTKQLQERAKNVKSAMNDEQESYEKQKKSIAEIWGENTQAYKVEMDKLEKTHDQTMESMILGYAKLGLEQGFSLQDMAGVWEMYGWTVDEVSQLVNASVNSTNENLDMLAKGTNEADMQWNSLALDPKTGEVRTNMADVLKDMSSTYEGWEQLRFIAKNADISTNAKEEIAIAMGESGKWNELYLTEQQLLVDGDEAKLQLYDTIEKLGMWNQYNADRKLLGVTNADAVYKLMESNGQLEQWNGLSPELKTMLADDPAKLTVEETKAALEEYNGIPADLKKLLGNNENLLANILNSETAWNGWLGLPDSQKNILLNNEDLMTKVFASEESLNAWNQLPDPVKNMLGNNEDILSKVQDGTISVEDYNKNVLPALKKLFGDNSDIIQKLTEGEISLDEYDENNPFKKILEGDSSSTQQAAKLGREQLDMFAKNNPKDKSLNARDNATVPAKKALKSVQEFAAQRNYEVTLTTRRVNINERIDVVSNGRSTGQYATHAAQGTNFHKGGDMIVNDQPGPLYKEIVHEPGKEPYIPVGRNVLIPNAKRGTKVYKASRTKSIMRRLGIPKYADGVGIPEDSSLVRNLRSLSPSSESSSINVRTQDYSKQFEMLIDIMSNFGEDLRNMQLILDGRNVMKLIETRQTNQQKLNDIKAGRRTI